MEFVWRTMERGVFTVLLISGLTVSIFFSGCLSNDESYGTFDYIISIGSDNVTAEFQLIIPLPLGYQLFETDLNDDSHRPESITTGRIVNTEKGKGFELNGTQGGGIWFSNFKISESYSHDLTMRTVTGDLNQTWMFLNTSVPDANFSVFIESRIKLVNKDPTTFDYYAIFNGSLDNPASIETMNLESIETLQHQTIDEGWTKVELHHGEYQVSGTYNP